MPTLTSNQIRALEVEFADDMRVAYSGRGMYGETCIGYTGDDLAYFTSQLVIVMSDDAHEWGIDDLTDEIADFPKPTTDSMGLGIIYYWPHLRTEVTDKENWQ